MASDIPATPHPISAPRNLVYRLQRLLGLGPLSETGESCCARRRSPARRSLPPRLVLGLIMLAAAAVVFSAHSWGPACNDCCRPDGSDGRGIGVWVGGIDANGMLWSNCRPADYPVCFFGGACQSCPPDECPPGSNGDPGSETWGAGMGGIARNESCRSCAGGGSGGAGPSGWCSETGWWVSEPSMTVWFKSTPMRYQPSRGPAVEFNLFCRDNWVADLAGESYLGVMAGFGEHWSSPWLCYVKQGAEIWTLYSGVGSAIPFHGFSTTDDPGYVAGWLDYRQRFTTCLSNGYRVVKYINGAQDVFGYAVADGLGNTRYFLTQRIDPQGNQLTFAYSESAGVVYLNSITDPDGHQVAFSFGVVNGMPVITGASDSYGHSVSLGYSDDGQLTSITDAAGLTSSFEYYTYWGAAVPYKLITPYGTNTFYNLGGTAVLVEEKGVGRHLYGYLEEDTAGRMPASYAALVPSTTGGTFSLPNTFETEQMHQRNSYYWNPRQYELLPSAFRSALEGGAYDPSLLTSSSFLLGRQRHWLLEAGGGQPLSLERAPSPDGTTQGQITWYDYPGKSNPEEAGSMLQPSIAAWKLPDGQSRFTYYDRNAAGHATSIIDTYTGPSGDVRVRTNSIGYAANNQDVVSVTNAAGVRIQYNIYNASHQVASNYNALGELTVYTYDGSGRLSSVTRPNGLVSTNLYGTGGYLSESRDIGIRTNYYTWANGLVQTHTDELNLTVTQTWDGLNRLTKTIYPDGTGITNTYQNLDLVQVTDRMGFAARFEYNQLRQKTATIDALNRTNTYDYCNCGVLTSATDALDQTTTYSYDYAGRLIQTLYADNFYVSYHRDLLGRATNIVDASGYSVTNWYNNQGLLVASSNVFGRISAAAYDILDRATDTTDANGVSVASAYDDLDRILTRTHPDGVEKFGYSLNLPGLASYTNQLDQVTRYGYDPAGRKTAETNANLEEIYFAYDPAGNLKTLTDGKANVTRWNYDPYGRVTNKVDQAGAAILRYGYDAKGRLTNRWSAAKGSTAYTYDAVANLTVVNYPASPDLTFTYDPLNRCTNMVDAVGTTRYGYTTGGEVLTEDGPFASDTVTYTYANRLRVGLSLQQPAGAWTNGFGYDAARRLSAVSSPAGTFGYDYSVSGVVRPGSLIRRLTLPNSSYITNTYDPEARLTGTWLKKNDHTVLDAAAYGYNAGNQRTTYTNATGTNVSYTYDAIGQLKVANSSVNAEDRGYFYDQGWNLRYRTNNGAVSSFSVDAKNQLLTAAGANCAYDANGNLAQVNNGVVTAYFYDDENQLVVITNGTGSAPPPMAAGALAPQLPQPVGGWKAEFVYDGQGRLRIRRDYYANSTAYTLTNTTWYIYDGKRVIQERNASDVPAVSYTRGTDLSGSLEGAGGIGGLLARSAGYSGGNWTSHAYYHADGNGNITYLVSSSQALAASYRYDPYGNLISKSGTLADANLYRFSSKELHVNSGLYYYLYRFYSPGWQRWLSRDPLGSPMVGPGSTGVLDNEFFPFEFSNGGNLYHYVYNNPINNIDPLGLDLWIIRDKCSKWGHEWVVGDNGDGTYWDSNKMPGKGPLAPANCPADIQFSPKSGFDPKNLNNPCLEIRRHVVTSPAVDKKARDEAEKRAREDKGRYDALGSNCRDYSQGMCDYAVGAKLRERLEKRKGK